MADDPIVQMASDPDFGKLPLSEQRKALAAHDPNFGQLGDSDISGFVQAHQGPNLRTGEGMEAAATSQAVKQARQPLDQLREKQTAFSMFTPTGITRDVGDPELGRVRKAADISSDVAGALTMVPGAAGTIAERGIVGGLKVLGKGLARTGIGAAAGGAAGGYAGRELGGVVGKPEAGRQLGAGIGGLAGGYVAGFHPDMFPSEGRMGRFFDRLRPATPPEFPGASLPASEEFYQNRGTDLMRRGVQEDILARRAAAAAKANAPEPPLGSPENPDFHSKLPTRMPKSAPQRTDPFAGATPSNAPFPDRPIPSAGAYNPPAATIQGVTADAYSPPAGIKGSIAKPSGRLILSPEEARAENAMQQVATQRAKQHGMLYAAGMRPAGGGRVPMTPTGTETFEYGGQKSAYEPPSEQVEVPDVGSPYGPAPVGVSGNGYSRTGGNGAYAPLEPFTPIHPDEVLEMSNSLGRPVAASDVPDIRRRLDAERNISSGLAGNRTDVTGNIREAHRAKLEKKGRI